LPKGLGIPSVEGFFWQGETRVLESLNLKGPQEEKDPSGVIGMGVGHDEVRKVPPRTRNQKTSYLIAGYQIPGIYEKGSIPRGLKIDGLTLSCIQEKYFECPGSDRKT